MVHTWKTDGYKALLAPWAPGWGNHEFLEECLQNKLSVNALDKVCVCSHCLFLSNSGWHDALRVSDPLTLVPSRVRPVIHRRVRPRSTGLPEVGT